MITMAAMGGICRPQLPTRPLPVLKARNCGRRGNSTVRVRAAASGTRGRRPQNADGDFFVDERCIDCDACRWLAPETFTRIGGQSAVFRQPSSEEERFRALQALLCCPTASIRTEKPPKEIRAVQSTFPLPVDEQSLPGVYHCGYHSERTYGATSYLIVHPEGNILVDSPKYKEILARRIDMLGGVRYMFLTHKDDVGDHQLWSKRFSCERILHSGDVRTSVITERSQSTCQHTHRITLGIGDVEPSTADVEMQLYGDGPWSIGTDFELIHTPGHTKGSVCLFYKPLKVLFTGDHLAKSGEFGWTIFEQYNHCSVKMQLASVQKFLHLDFLWILPGHGRRGKFRDVDEKNSAMDAFLAAKAHKYDSALVA